MRRSELVAAVQKNEGVGVAILSTLSASLARRYRASAARRGGVLCLACARIPIWLLHRALGFGTFGGGDATTLARIARHYARLGTPARMHVAEAAVAARSLQALERAGFRREDEAFDVHVLAARRAPAAPTIPGLAVERVAPPEARAYARLTRRNFDMSGELGDLVEEATRLMVVSRRRDIVPLVARVDGRMVGTGVLLVAGGVGGLYSGSVHPDFRGRGIQLALIAERVRVGIGRGLTTFMSQAEIDSPSQHNLMEAGFRALYRASFWARQASAG